MNPVIFSIGPKRMNKASYKTHKPPQETPVRQANPLNSSEPSESSLRNGGKVGSIVIVGQKEAFSPVFRSANSCCFTDPILDEKNKIFFSSRWLELEVSQPYYQVKNKIWSEPNGALFWHNVAFFRPIALYQVY